MQDEVAHHVRELASAYRRLNGLLDEAELKSEPSERDQAHAVALRTACRELDAFSDVIRALVAERARRMLDGEDFEPTSLRPVDRTQLRTLLDAQERLFRQVGIEPDTARALVEEARATLEQPLFFDFNMPRFAVFETLGQRTCDLAGEFERATQPQAEEHRAGARKLVRLTLRTLAAVAGAAVPLLAPSLLPVAVAAMLAGPVQLLLDEAAAAIANALEPPSRSRSIQVEWIEVYEQEPSTSGTVQERHPPRRRVESERERYLGSGGDRPN